jgi:SSS family solute:Na+ symporter
MTFSIILLAVFLLGMVVIGLWGMKKTSTLNDFFLGGRTVGPWITAFAYGTTYFSAVIFIGFGGKIGWGYGLKGLWIAAGNAFIGTLLAWVVLGRRTRRMTQNLDTMTMPEFLNERYGSSFIKAFAAMIIFIFLIPYSAGVFQGLSYLFEANFHIPYDYALIIMVAITGLYLILGGYFAVTLTDFVQGLIMLVGAVVLVAVLSEKANQLLGASGGIGSAMSGAADRYNEFFKNVPPAKQPSLLMLGGLVFMTSFGVWGMPQMVQKFYAIKNESVIAKAAIVTTIFAGVITFAAYYTGALTHIFYDKASIPMMADPSKGIDPDKVIPMLLTQHLPSTLMAVILLLILSASMSTLSSLVLVSASSIAIDLYKGHVEPDISKERSLLMMRFLSGVFVAFSYFIARYKVGIIVELMSLSWGAVAGAFMAAFFYGLYWKRTTHAGAVAGMVTGLGLSIGLAYYFGKPMTPITASVSMIVPFVVIPVVSAFTKPPRKELIDKAFANIGAAKSATDETSAKVAVV